MNSAERIEYVASLLTVIYADGEVSVEESALIDLISRDMGVGAFFFEKALERAKASDFEIFIPTRYSDKLRLIEDMLTVAYADKRLDAAEKGIILKLVKEFGISQEQLNRLSAYAKSV